MASVIALADRGEKPVPKDHGPVLSYHSAVLYKEDAALLQPGQWFSDSIMTWWCEYMAHSVYPDRTDLAFLHPSAVFLARFQSMLCGLLNFALYCGPVLG